jgi:hypothetical protein
LWYDERDYAPVPIQRGSKIPLWKWGGKKFPDRRLSKEEIAKWFNVQSPPDMGLILNGPVAVLDLDTKNSPHLGPLIRHLEGVTLCTRTPSGGLHAFLRQPEGQVPTRQGIAHGVDLQGWRSLTIEPPSTSRHFVNDLPVLEVGDVTRWVIDLLNAFDLRPHETKSDFINDEDVTIQQGTTNNTLAGMAGLMRKMGWAPNIVEAALKGVNDSCTESPVPHEEIAHILETIGHRGSEPLELDGSRTYLISPDDEVPPQEWLVSAFLPEKAIALLYGLPAQGKSWVALDIAMAVQNGWQWLDRDVKQGNVMYCDWERRGDMTKLRVKLLTKTGRGIWYRECSKSLVEEIENIVLEIKSRNIKLVIIDSLTIAFQGVDAMAQNEVVSAMFAMHKLIDAGATVLCLDHQKKKQSHESKWDAGAFGSIFKEAIASIVWQAGKTNDQFTDGYMDFKLRPVKNNYDLSLSDINLRLIIERSEPAKVSDYVQIITHDPPKPDSDETLLKNQWMLRPEPVSLDAVCKRMTWGNKRARSALDGLVETGEAVIYHKGGGRGNVALWALSEFLPIDYEPIEVTIAGNPVADDDEEEE